MLIYEIHKAFEEHKIPYVIVGGYALAFHQIVRATVDVDLVIKLDLDTFEKAEKALKELGLQSRLPVTAKDIITFRKEYIENRNLIAWSFIDPKNPMRQVDILITINMGSLKIDKVSVGGLKIPVVSLNDLMSMKKKAGRPQDLLDVEMIEKRLKEIKNEKNNSKSIHDGLVFIDSFQKMLADQDDKTIAISLRIPKNILTAVKIRAKSENKKYQSLIVEYIRDGLKKK